MKIAFILSAFALVGSCATTKYSTKIENLKSGITLKDSSAIATYSKSITSEELKKHLYIFASDEFEGRHTGTIGQKKASKFLSDYYTNIDIKPIINDTSYYQSIPASYLPKDVEDSENILAYIKGSEFPDEFVIISGHFDHKGFDEGELHPGADDNGSGTVAIMEIAQAFKLAADEGFKPKRSIMFLHLTAEEIGLQGSRYYTENPVFDLQNAVANLNIDMIGRIDEAHKNDPNYIYIIGADRISKELHFANEAVNNMYTNLKLEYKYNDENDNNRYYYRSDHYNFARKGIPVIFYFNGEHEDYHKPTDTPDKINYDVLEKRAQLIFSTAWHIANQNNRLILNTEI